MPRGLVVVSLFLAYSQHRFHEHVDVDGGCTHDAFSTSAMISRSFLKCHILSDLAPILCSSLEST